MCTYSQTSGELRHNGTHIGVGYAGGDKGSHPEGKNNPDMQAIHGIGPLPVGLYTIAPPRHSPQLGPYVLDLSPDSTNEMCGRSLFQIMGNSKKKKGGGSAG